MSIIEVSQKPEPMIFATRVVAPYVILALIVAAVYTNIFGNAFLFDDNLLIEINDNLRDWHHLGAILSGSTTSGAHIEGGFFRPLQMLLYLIIYQLGGGTVFGFHLLNVSLHVTNTALVYRLGTKLKFAPWGVFLAALAWGVHPLHTEAITYMSATADPLFTFFCLTAIITLLPDISPRKIFIALPLFILGLLSKETAAMFPLLVMACIFLVNPKRLDWRIYIRTWPLWGVALIYVLWRIHAKGFDGPQTYDALLHLPNLTNFTLYFDHPLYRFYTLLATLPAYFVLLIWPVGLHMERIFPIYTSLTTAPVLAGLSATVFAAAHIVRNSLRPQQNFALSWGFLWFAGAYSPDSGLIWPTNSLFLEHWMYLPSIGLFLGVAETLAQVLRPHRYVAIGASIAALVFAGNLSIKTFMQNEVWLDPLHFYANILAHNDHSARAHNNLALYFGSHNDFENALAHYRRAIEISDIYAETQYNLALTYLHLPDMDAHVPDAIDHLNRAVKIDPRFYRAWQVLAALYEKNGETEKAATCRLKANALTAPP